jgi:Raf kinase inhibitor-like YbhB/YbcL family protein
MIGKLLRRLPVAGERRSPFAGPDFAAPFAVTVTSAAFAEGAAIPKANAGKGVGDNLSPQLSWTGVPPGTRQLVLIIDDVDVPLPRPIVHNAAVLDPTITHLDTGALQPGTAGIQAIRADLRQHGYAGPRPIPGHGPHHYRFQLFALDAPITQPVSTVKALRKQMAGHVLARGLLTGTYER